ncbi:g7476 [Coccomyxa viridis]|uniref:G7476 protein n=1 Tax=Coccomyxa viridis TaxID=1274662 RepID=A0ABP1G2V3_9CHLO
MERGWLDKLEACKGFDNGQKAELRGRLLALQSVGVNPNVTLMESDEDIRRCLDGLYNAHTRPKLTLREVMGVILPKVERPSTPQEPPSTTQHPLPKSFGIVLSWPDFRKGSQALYGSLNNTDRLYTVPTYDFVDGALSNSKATEVPMVSQWLAESKTVLQPSAKPCSSFDKGEWDFELKRGDRLEDRLHNTEKIEAIVRVVQEAFGDAVFDKAPLLALTNYDVTIFLKRSQDVKDKRLWASEPIWFDDTSPPPQVFWLYGLQTAHQLQGWKERLPRADVPANRKRKLIAEEQAKGASSASRHVRPRKATVSSPRQACHPLHKGHGMELWPSAALHLADDLIDLGLEETVLLSELEFGGLINIGSYANTFKGVLERRSVAIKIFNTKKSGAIAAYASEKHAYLQLKTLQGEAIPYLWRSGLLAHTSAPVIVTSLEGNALDEDHPVPKDLHWPMRKALRALHAGAWEYLAYDHDPREGYGNPS